MSPADKVAGAWNLLPFIS